ncbi:MAG: CopG family transcriptional regulator [Oscillospiraceae bacterium]|nr:CopG family transcriptional regulator [Oscillospiraceae bacterium]
MSSKMGRPKAENPLTIEVKARIDKETNDKLVKYCKENKVTRTEVVREGIKQVIEKK